MSKVALVDGCISFSDLFTVLLLPSGGSSGADVVLEAASNVRCSSFSPFLLLLLLQ